MPPVHYCYPAYYQAGVDNCVAFTFKNLLELNDRRRLPKGVDLHAEDASRALYFMLTFIDCINKGTAKIDMEALRRFAATVPISNRTFHSLVAELEDAHPNRQYLVRALLRHHGEITLDRNAYMLFLSQITRAECVDLSARNAKQKLYEAFFEHQEPVLISEAGGPDNQHKPLFSRLTNSTVRGGHLCLIYPIKGQLYLVEPNLRAPMPISFNLLNSRIRGQFNIYDQSTNRAYIIHTWPRIPDWLRKETDRRWPPVNAFAADLYNFRVSK